jgi:HEAT repeat protein
MVFKNKILNMPFLLLFFLFNLFLYMCSQSNKDSRTAISLIATLKDEDSTIRARAEEALVKIGTSAVEPLIAALKDENRFVRFNAATALGEIKDFRAVEPLMVVLKDKDSSVRAYSAEALGKIRMPVPLNP